MRFELHDEVKAKIIDKGVQRSADGYICGRCTVNGVALYDVFETRNGEIAVHQNIRDEGDTIVMSRRPPEDELKTRVVGKIVLTTIPISTPQPEKVAA